jgi:hypothetical protein
VLLGSQGVGGRLSAPRDGVVHHVVVEEGEGMRASARTRRPGVDHEPTDLVDRSSEGRPAGTSTSTPSGRRLVGRPQPLLPP